MRGGREMHSARLSVTATLCCILSLHKHRAIFMYQNDPSHELLYFPPACISSFPIHSVHAYFKLRQRRDSRPELPSRLLIHNYVRLHRTLMMIILQPSKTSHSSSVRRPPFCSPLPVSCFSHVPLLFPTFLISSKLLLFLPTITSPSAQSVPPPESGCKHFQQVFHTRCEATLPPRGRWNIGGGCWKVFVTSSSLKTTGFKWCYFTLCRDNLWIILDIPAWHEAPNERKYLQNKSLYNCYSCM